LVNKEHYARLREGVQAWNEWRLKNPEIILELSGVDLSNIHLNGANLSGVDLSEANLSYSNLSASFLDNANFSEAILTQANLSYSEIREANLNRANLSEAILTQANLAGANLSGANLSEAILTQANLAGANLSGANLSRANLSRASLTDVDISGANRNDIYLTELSDYGLELSGTNFTGANLSNVVLDNANIKYANLSGFDLNEANLTDADLSYSDLCETNLSGAKLIRTQALRTNFTAANFTGACLEDWNINSATKLNDIDCQYVYLKSKQQERRPSGRDFVSGEFTKLFQKALETVDLIFTDGIDWKAFLLSFQELQVEYGEENLSVQAIEKKSGSAFVIRLEVPPEANKADIESQAKALYELRLNALEAIYRNQLKAKDVQIEIYHKENANLWELVKLAASKPIQIQNTIDVTAKADNNSMVDNSKKQSTFNLQDAQFAGGLVNADIVNAQQIGGNITNYTPEQKHNLAQAAAEIQQLLYQLSQTSSTTDEAITEAIHQEIKHNPTLKTRLKSALKAGGLEALKAIFNHPLFNIPSETIKGFLEVE
jgi:uncharacterized protein YjbI with pentapeptide repeats